jgi:hypothetical protein
MIRSREVAASALALLFVVASAGCAEGSTPSPIGTAGSGTAGSGTAGSGTAGDVGSGGSDLAGAAGTSGAAGSSGAAGMSGAAGSSGAGMFHAPWDWAGIVGTGQSLAVGDPGSARGTADAAVRATTQPFQNLKLSTGNLPWPIDPDDATLTMLPLVEPVGRPAPNYPGSWPTNISGETPHAVMANQISTLVQASQAVDYVSVHGVVGENGQCLTRLIKGAAPAMDGTGRAYEATLVEARAITRLAEAAGKTYGVGAITVTHGECDAGNTSYAAQLHQLWSDYKTDLATITGQTEPPLLIVSQQNSTNNSSASTLAQWKIGVDYPADAVCSGPKYQYPSSDGTHLLVSGYERLGEKYGQVYYERVVMGRAWQPLQPTTATREGRVIRVAFQVPVPPLVWEDTFQAPHQSALTEWSQGKGFEVRAGTTPVAISSVAISDDAVEITCATDLPASGLTVAYALTADPTPVRMATPFPGTFRWGQLRDSDPFVGSTTQQAQPNFAVAFELAVP